MANDFFREFKKNMDAMGLPCPESLFGSITSTTATIGAMATGVKTVGATATLSEVLLTFPLGSSATAVAAAITELTAVAGALAASFYLGACIGSLIIAAVKVSGPYAYAQISGVLSEVAAALGTSIAELLRMTLRFYPQAAPIAPSIVTLGQVTRPSPRQRQRA